MLYPPCLANRPAIQAPRPPQPISPKSILELASVPLTSLAFNNVTDTADAPALARNLRRVSSGIGPAWPELGRFDGQWSFIGGEITFLVNVGAGATQKSSVRN